MRAFFIITLLLWGCTKPMLNPKNFTNTEPDVNDFTNSGFQSFGIKDTLYFINDFTTSGNVQHKIKIYAGELVYATHNGRLNFTSLSDLDNTRKTELAKGVEAAPLISEGTLWLAGNKAKFGLQSYNMLTSKINWQIKGDRSVSTPILFKDKIIHATINGEVKAYEKQTGTVLWSVKTNGPVRNSLAMNQNGIFAANQKGEIRSINPNNGMTNWVLHTPAGFYAAPVLSTHGLYVVNYEGTLFHIEQKSGLIIQKIKLNRHVLNTPNLNNTQLIVTTTAGDIISFSSKTLQKQWHSKIKGPVAYQPLSGEKHLVLTTTDNLLFVLKRENGTVIQKRKIAGNAYASPVFFNSQIVVPAVQNRLLLFSTTGEVQ